MIWYITHAGDHQQLATNGHQ